MVEAFADPGSALARGLQSGVQMVSNIEELKQRKHAQEWEKDMGIAKLGMELGTNKNLPADMRANALNNGLVPVWNKHKINGQEMKPFTADDFKDKLLNETADSVSKIMGDKKLNSKQKYEATTNAWTNYYKTKGNADEAAKLQTDMMKHNDTKDKENAPPKPPAPDDAFKRQTDIVTNIGKLDSGDFNDQLMAGFAAKAGINVQPGQKMTPEMKVIVKNQAKAEFESLNQYMPEGQRRYMVTPDEMEKIKRAPGVTAADLSRVFVLP